MPTNCVRYMKWFTPYWEQLGVNHFIFRTHFLGMPVSLAMQSIRMISTELLPALRNI